MSARDFSESRVRTEAAGLVDRAETLADLARLDSLIAELRESLERAERLAATMRAGLADGRRSLQ